MNGASIRKDNGNDVVNVGQYSAISGGENNVSSGDYSIVLGGRDNSASGTDAVALGKRSVTDHDCAVTVGLRSVTTHSRGKSTVTIGFDEGETHRGLYLLNNPVDEGVDRVLGLDASGRVVTTDFSGVRACCETFETWKDNLGPVKINNLEFNAQCLGIQGSSCDRTLLDWNETLTDYYWTKGIREIVPDEGGTGGKEVVYYYTNRGTGCAVFVHVVRTAITNGTIYISTIDPRLQGVTSGSKTGNFRFSFFKDWDEYTSTGSNPLTNTLVYFSISDLDTDEAVSMERALFDSYNLFANVGVEPTVSVGPTFITFSGGGGNVQPNGGFNSCILLSNNRNSFDVKYTSTGGLGVFLDLNSSDGSTWYGDRAQVKFCLTNAIFGSEHYTYRLEMDPYSNVEFYSLDNPATETFEFTQKDVDDGKISIFLPNVEATHEFSFAGTVTDAISGGVTPFSSKQTASGNDCNECDNTGQGLHVDPLTNKATIRRDNNDVINVGMCSTIMGGCGNVASGQHSVVGGGGAGQLFYGGMPIPLPFDFSGNVASGPWGAVLGGTNNHSTGFFSLVGSGLGNQSTEFNTVIVAGASNRCDGSYSTVVNGDGNTNSGQKSLIGGGSKNVIDGSSLESAIVGGTSNQLLSTHQGFVGGGMRHDVSGSRFGVIVGGSGNTQTGDQSFIGGGKNNRCYSKYSFIGGGGFNECHSKYSFVGGGQQNVCRSKHSSIVGGYRNTTRGDYSTVLGGLMNDTSGMTSLAAGFQAKARHDRAFVFGLGDSPTTSLAKSTLTVGFDANYSDRGLYLINNQVVSQANELLSIDASGCVKSISLSDVLTGAGLFAEKDDASGSTFRKAVSNFLGSGTHYSTLSGGQSNIGLSGEFMTIAGGARNTAYGSFSTISGGRSNNNSGAYGTVGGGHRNEIGGSLSVVAGGGKNLAGTGIASVISGGYGNLVSDNSSMGVIGGGSGNVVDGSGSSILGGLGNLCEGQYSTIGGGYSNKIDDLADKCTISGGCRNTAEGDYATISGGKSNFGFSLASSYSVISGGELNTVNGKHTSIGGGLSNTCQGQSSTIAGGESNTTTTTHATVGGGKNNEATQKYATVGGGVANRARDRYSLVSGGQSNTASGSNAVVSGGGHNTAHGSFSVISGGSNNSATFDSVISGGKNNTTIGGVSTISGGQGNHASGFGSVVSGGSNNTATGVASIVSGGSNNKAGATLSTVSGGSFNTADQNSCVVSGGFSNTAFLEAATVSGGKCNTAMGTSSVVSGGEKNAISGGNHSVISGGILNTVSTGSAVISGGGFNRATEHASVVSGGISNTSSGMYSVVSAGFRNTSSGSNAVVSGGSSNTALGIHAVVSGGNLNRALSRYAVVSGGSRNTAAGSNSVVSGGASNTALGSNAAIGGGRYNDASGHFSTVIGGRYNTASGTYSVAMGHKATAAHNNSLVIGLQGSTTTSSQDQSTLTVGFDSSKTSRGLYLLNNPPGTGASLTIETTTGRVLGMGSSRQFKSEIDDLSREAIDRIKRLRPVSFRWETQSSKPLDYGLIAEEVEEIMPEIVEKDGSGLPYSVRYLSLISLLLKKCQQLDEQNASFRTELDDLKKQVQLLKRRK
jgi:hypothetical protein